MAKRNEHHKKQLQEQVTRKTYNVLGIVAIAGLVACVFINAVYKASVPDIVFWIFGAAIVPDFVKLIRGDKS